MLNGRRLEDLAGHLSFEAAIDHLWSGTVSAGSSQLNDLVRLLGRARQEAFATVPVMLAETGSLSIVERLQVGLSALPISEDLPEAVAITGAFPVLVAAAARDSGGLLPIAPEPALPAAEDFLRLLSGETPEPWTVDALERYLVTVLDHGLNASTFTARVIASTQANMKDATLGAVGALKGPLHGGAPGPVLDMLDAIEIPDNAAEWIASALAKGDRLMGFGHRIYRTRDPRADALKAGLAHVPETDRLALAEAVEQAALTALSKAKPDRVLETNVEFYTAVLLDSIGLDRSLFTPVFAIGRAAGWCAHVVEQQTTGKLIRPASVYVGPLPV
ncbi:citrate synthase [Roseibium sp. TrichSKD4]|uniref:citrate synthase n=1 Tax=Roseibium sp. TrichSKD4 TaxID=744980 RepID=UPI001FFCDC1C|nr:citrate synthase [Roseibium sp. TrichSKD4]